MFLLICFSLIVGLLGLWLFTFYNYYKYLKNVPSPPVFPFIGSALEFLSAEDLLGKFSILYKKYNTKTIRIHIGFRTVIQTIDYKILEHLFSSQSILTKGHGYEFLARWLNTGLLTSDGEKWRKRRKLITPTFHFQILEQFSEVFDAKSAIMVEKMRRDVGKSSMDVFPHVTLCALDIICETAMGTSANVQLQESSEYVQCVKYMGKLLQRRAMNPLYHWDFVYKFSKLYKEETDALNVIHTYADSVIKNRRAELIRSQESPQKTEQDTMMGIKKKTALLDMLLQTTVDGQPLSDADVREEVDTFMFAGHDTTSAGVSYALFSIANDPEIQRKAYEEIRDIFGDDPNRPCTYKDLQDMKYLDLIIKETLRLYPSAPMVARRITEDVRMGDLMLPKGITLGVNIFHIHRDPEVYPNPTKFDPERFNSENHKGAQPYTYIPFSAGPRNCIGQKYAQLEMKSQISRVLRTYKLSPATPKHELILKAETILNSANGMRIRIDLR